MEHGRDVHAVPAAPHVLLLGRLLVAVQAQEQAPIAPRGLAARLLSMLAVEGDDGCADEVLIDRLWMGMPPANASFSLRNQVTALRRMLDRDAIVRTAGGYRLDRERHPSDLDCFDALARAAEAAHRSDPRSALELLDAALGLVRGPALADVRHEAWAVRFVDVADERVRGAEDLWAHLVLDVGAAPEHLARLRTLAEEQPRREHRWAHLIDACARNGQRTDALRAAHDARVALAAVGLRVGPSILEAEQRALSTPAATLAPRGRLRLAAARAEPLVGRDSAMRVLARGARVVVVDGGPAVGTTSLLAEHAWAAEQSGVTVLYVRADGVSDEPRFVAALAHELVAAADRSVIDPDLRPLLDPIEDAPFRADPTTSSALPRRALQQLVDDLAVAGSLLLVVDDAHLLSADERRLVRQFVETAPADARFVLAGRGTVSSPAWWEDIAPVAADAVVELRPLRRDDVVDLVRRSGVHVDDVTAAADVIWTASGGIPLVASRMVAEWTRNGRPDAGASRWSPLLREALGELDDESRTVLVALALLDRPIDDQALAVAVALPQDGVDAALADLQLRGLVDRDHGRARSVDDTYAAIARASAFPGVRDRMRRRLIEHAEVDEREPGLILGLLLEDAVDQRRFAARLDDLFLRVAGDLLAAGAVGSARDVAQRYLAAVGHGDGRHRSVQARLVVATLLLSSSETALEGMALLAVVEAQARALDDPELIADSVLARGPVDTGGRHSRHTAAVAESLVARVRTDDVARRVQLLCWAAHHRVNAGELDAAAALLAEADAAAGSSADPAWRALVLGVRVQGQLSALGSPSGALEALAELERWTALTRSLTADGASRLLAVSCAFGVGSLDDVERAAAGIRDVSLVLPRPDLCWFPSTIAAALALARGDVGAANGAIEAASALGRSLGVSGAGPVAATHLLLLSLLTDSLGSLAAVLEAAVAGEHPSADRLAVLALASVRVGEDGRAIAIADALAARGTLLAGTGVGWPLVAMVSAEVAWATRHEGLAELLWRELRGWSGWGLNMNGVAYVGAADTWLGLAAAAMSRPRVATELLAAGATQDARRGATWWSSRAAALREEVCG